MRWILFFAVLSVSLIQTRNVYATECDTQLTASRLVGGRYPFHQEILLENVVLDTGGEIFGRPTESRIEIEIENNRTGSYVWDSENDHLKFEILQYMQAYRSRGVRRTLPVTLRGHFEIGDNGLRTSIFIITEFVPSGTIG